MTIVSGFDLHICGSIFAHNLLNFILTFFYIITKIRVKHYCLFSFEINFIVFIFYLKINCTHFLCILFQISIIAPERDEFQRAEFVHFISQFPKQYLLFVDESSKDDRSGQVRLPSFYTSK